MALEILYDDRTELGLVEKYNNIIERVAQKTLELEGIKFNASISFSFVDNKEIQTINKKFRKIDRATDVLSFPLLDFSEDNTFSQNEIYEIGDIIVSYEKAIAQAEEYNHSIDREIAFLTAHSILHLLGYDHMTDDEEKEMFSKQDLVLNSLGIFR